MVNIKAKDGEIVQQNFFADPEKDYVTIDFKNNEGRFVTVYIDFRLVSFFYDSCLNCYDQSFIELKKYYFQNCHPLIEENYAYALVISSTKEAKYFLQHKFKLVLELNSIQFYLTYAEYYVHRVRLVSRYYLRKIEEEGKNKFDNKL